MRPQWGSNREPNADPAIEAAYRQLMGAVDNLRTARIRLQNFDMQAYLNEPTEVTEDFMRILAERPGASPQLSAYLLRVQSGECRWSDIELFWPLPPEVDELKTSDRFIWKWSPKPPEPPSEPRRARPDPKAVGPSDWPDDFDDYPTQRSWLI